MKNTDTDYVKAEDDYRLKSSSSNAQRVRRLFKLPQFIHRKFPFVQESWSDQMTDKALSHSHDLIQASSLHSYIEQLTSKNNVLF